MDLKKVIKYRILKYGIKGNIGHTIKLFLKLAEIRHSLVRKHMERVALLSEAVAKKLKKDKKAAFIAGILHDIGKIVLSDNLFDGHNINNDEYQEIKSHPFYAWKILGDFHLFSAIVSGLHHGIYKNGYGIGLENLPKELGIETIRKALDMATIISICDFIDAFTNRETKIKDGSDDKADDLEGMLRKKYPNDILIVKTALQIHKEIKFE